MEHYVACVKSSKIFILSTAEYFLRFYLKFKNMHKYFCHNFTYNSENFGLSYVSLCSTWRGCKDDIHVRDLVVETPVKDEGEAGVGRTFRVRSGLKPMKGEK